MLIFISSLFHKFPQCNVRTWRNVCRATTKMQNLQNKQDTYTHTVVLSLSELLQCRWLVSLVTSMQSVWMSWETRQGHWGSNSAFSLQVTYVCVCRGDLWLESVPRGLSPGIFSHLRFHSQNVFFCFCAGDSSDQRHYVFRLSVPFLWTPYVR